MTKRLHFHFSLLWIGEGNGNPLQCSCLENPRDGAAWWAAICGVAQSRTRLKWLSSSSSMSVWIAKINWIQLFVTQSLFSLGDDIWTTSHTGWWSQFWGVSRAGQCCTPLSPALGHQLRPGRAPHLAEHRRACTGRKVPRSVPEERCLYPRKLFISIVYKLDKFESCKLENSDIAQLFCFTLQVTPGKLRLF